MVTGIWVAATPAVAVFCFDLFFDSVVFFFFAVIMARPQVPLKNKPTLTGEVLDVFIATEQ